MLEFKKYQDDDGYTVFHVSAEAPVWVWALAVVAIAGIYLLV